MKIPNKLKIGGHIIRVIVKDIEDANASYTFSDGLITIHKNQPRTQKESSLIHEIFHVINSTIGDSHIGHSLLDSLSEQLYQVLKDNNMLR